MDIRHKNHNSNKHGKLEIKGDSKTSNRTRQIEEYGASEIYPVLAEKFTEVFMKEGST